MRKVEEIFEYAKVLVYAIGFRLCKNEVKHINESLKTKSIPTPKLLIKSHKKLTSKGDLPTRLVIAATHLLANFAKVGYRGLKKYWKIMRLIIQDS